MVINIYLYSCINEMSSLEVGSSDINYENAQKYWSDIPATIDGVLGGFGFISDIDIEGSKNFLDTLLLSDSAPSTDLALDCGAGIGRITKNLLLPYFKVVDVVEPDGKFINTIKSYVGEHQSHVGDLYEVGLQDFNPTKKYDVIWNQWVLGYLQDQDLVAYLSRCRNSLKRNGVIIIKENVTSSGKSEIDETDSSVTRSLKQFVNIFKQSNLKRLKQCKQSNFPNGIYPVYMFALIPITDDCDSDIKKA